jgi:uncharacterized protein YsxB (DUF464 family)
MIEVRFRVFKNGSFKFSCIGHAGAGEKGSDLVCAGASALAYGLAENVKQSEAFFESGNMAINDGMMKLSFKCQKEYINSMYLIFSVFRNAFLLLQKGNEKYIHVG